MFLSLQTIQWGCLDLYFPSLWFVFQIHYQALQKWSLYFSQGLFLTRVGQFVTFGATKNSPCVYSVNFRLCNENNNIFQSCVADHHKITHSTVVCTCAHIIMAWNTWWSPKFGRLLNLTLHFGVGSFLTRGLSLREPSPREPSLGEP